QIQHLAPQARVRELQRIEQRVHVFHADAVNDDVGGGIVAHGNHEGRNIANRQAGDAWSQGAGNSAPSDEVTRLQGVQIGELDFALLRLPVKLGEDGDLDGAGRRKHFIRVEQ